MNATDFMKEHGVEKAREVVEGAPQNAVYYWQIPRCKYGVYSSHEQKQGRAIALEELKRLVESLDLVKSYGGIINAKHDVKYLDLDWDYDTPRVTRLKQAIADYELIYEVK